MREAAARYGLRVDRQGWACCPFHRENKPSLRVYDGAGGWHCFGCGAGGSVIDYVMRAEGLTARQAMRKLNQDFALDLPLDTPPDWRTRNRAALEAAKIKQAELAQREAEARAIAAWERAFDDWLRLDRWARENAPKRPAKASDWDVPPLYAYAVHRLPAARFEALEAQQTMIDTLERGRRGEWRPRATQAAT